MTKQRTIPGYDIVRHTPGLYHITCRLCHWNTLMILTRTGVEELAAYHTRNFHTEIPHA